MHAFNPAVKTNDTLTFPVIYQRNIYSYDISEEACQPSVRKIVINQGPD